MRAQRNVLLTGGSGFIGRNLLESKLLADWQVLAPGHRELDLIDEVAVSQFLEAHQVDFIVHSAVKPGHRNAKDHSNLMLTNTRIFFSLARNLRPEQRMVVIGSGAIYDMRDYQPKVKEEDYNLRLPADDHGFSKYVIEKYIERTRNIFDLRVFGVYGKYEDSQIRFISNMICKALFDLPLTIKQDRRFDYIHVSDLAPVVYQTLERGLPWPSMNVTPDSSVLLSDIAKLVLKLVGKPHLPIVIAQPGLGSEYSGDNRRMKSFMDEFDLKSLEDGVSELVTWYKSIVHELDRANYVVDP